MSIKLKTNSSLVTFVEAKAPTPSNFTRYVRLGLTKCETSSIEDVVGRIIQSLEGGSSSKLTLSTAEGIAREMSRRLGVEVRIVKQETIGSYPHIQELYFTFAPTTREKTLKDGINPDDVYEPVAFELLDVSKTRTLVALCQEAPFRLISPADGADLAPHIKELETQLIAMAAIRNTMNEEQTAALEMLAEPYINTIIEACAAAETGADLIGEAHAHLFTADEAFAGCSKRSIALAVLLGALQTHANTLCYEQVPGLKKCYGSALELYNMYQGAFAPATEATLRRLGDTIPDIVCRRLALIALIERKLTEKFGKEEIAPIAGFSPALIQGMRAVLFAEGLNLNTLAHDYSAHSESSPLKLMIDTTKTTVDVLQGKLADESYSFQWYQNGEFLKGAEAVAKAAAIRSQIEAIVDEATAAPAAAAGGAGSA